MSIAEEMGPEQAREYRLHLQQVLRDTKKMKVLARRAGLKGTPTWSEVNETIRMLEGKIRGLR